MFDVTLDAAITVLNLFIQLGLFGPILLLAVGFLIGCWFYRWMIKRDPAKLELWAAEAKRLGEKAKSKLG